MTFFDYYHALLGLIRDYVEVVERFSVLGYMGHLG
jgi:hypothetical protein